MANLYNQMCKHGNLNTYEPVKFKGVVKLIAIADCMGAKITWVQNFKAVIRSSRTYRGVMRFWLRPMQ